MNVYIKPEGEMLAAVVTAVHEDSLDVRDEKGGMYVGYMAAVYDQDENEIPLEDIRRDFAPNDEETQYAQAGRILMGVAE